MGEQASPKAVDVNTVTPKPVPPPSGCALKKAENTVDKSTTENRKTFSPIDKPILTVGKDNTVTEFTPAELTPEKDSKDSSIWYKFW